LIIVFLIDIPKIIIYDAYVVVIIPLRVDFWINFIGNPPNLQDWVRIT
jgi:hypothetical protein